jgi:hypothetical protein
VCVQLGCRACFRVKLDNRAHMPGGHSACWCWLEGTFACYGALGAQVPPAVVQGEFLGMCCVARVVSGVCAAAN